MRVPVAAGVVAAAAIAGGLVGAVFALAGGTQHRAQVTMLVARGSALPRSSEEALQSARTVSALVDTDAVDSRVAAALRLDERTVASALSARPRGSSGLVVLTAVRPRADDAARLAQQAGLVVSQLVLTRLGSTGLRASIWDPARGAGTVGRPAALDAVRPARPPGRHRPNRGLSPLSSRKHRPRRGLSPLLRRKLRSRYRSRRGLSPLSSRGRPSRSSPSRSGSASARSSRRSQARRPAAARSSTPTSRPCARRRTKPACCPRASRRSCARSSAISSEPSLRWAACRAR